eukprot:scpid111547/ scgid10034/ 
MNRQEVELDRATHKAKVLSCIVAKLSTTLVQPSQQSYDYGSSDPKSSHLLTMGTMHSSFIPTAQSPSQHVQYRHTDTSLPNFSRSWQDAAWLALRGGITSASSSYTLC